MFQCMEPPWKPLPTWGSGPRLVAANIKPYSYWRTRSACKFSTPGPVKPIKKKRRGQPKSQTKKGVRKQATTKVLVPPSVRYQIAVCLRDGKAERKFFHKKLGYPQPRLTKYVQTLESKGVDGFYATGKPWDLDRKACDQLREDIGTKFDVLVEGKLASGFNLREWGQLVELRRKETYERRTGLPSLQSHFGISLTQVLLVYLSCLYLFRSDR